MFNEPSTHSHKHITHLQIGSGTWGNVSVSVEISPPSDGDAMAFVAAGVVQTGSDGRGVYLGIARNGSWVIAEKLSFLVGRSNTIAQGQAGHPPGAGGYFTVGLKLSTSYRTTATARVGEETVWQGEVKAIERGTVMMNECLSFHEDVCDWCVRYPILWRCLIGACDILPCGDV